MTRKHDRALEALVAPDPVLGGRLFPGVVPDGTPLPYAVYDSMNGNDTVQREAGPALTTHPRWTIRAVGSTVNQAKAATERLKACLVRNGFGVIPEVEGESPGRFWFSNPIPVQRDDEPNPPLFYEVTECGFNSDLF